MKRPGSTAPGLRTRRGLAAFCTAMFALWIAGIPPRAAGDDPSPSTRGLTAVARPLVPAERAGEKVDVDGSAGLFVGVGRFDPVSGLADLRFTPDDAVALAHLFALEFKLIPPAHVRIALGGEPRSANGKAMLHELVEAGASVGAAKRVELLDALDATVRDASAPEGLLVVSVGSHGFEEKGTAYVMPSDGRRKYVGSTGVSVQSVKDTLREARANKRVLILDACRETLGTEVRGEAKMDSALREALKASEGFAILASCGAGQLSWESPELEQGVFTHFLLEAVRGGAGADSADGFIRLGDASAHATRATRDWVKAQKNEIQEPWFEGELGRSIPLAVHPVALQRREEARAADARLEARRQNARRLLALAVAEDTENQFPADTLVSVRTTLERVSGKNLEDLLVELEALAENTPRNRRIFAQYWRDRRTTFGVRTIASTSRPSQLPTNAAVAIMATNTGHEIFDGLSKLDIPKVPTASADKPWKNSFGMPFVPVPGATNVLMCAWETPRSAYGVFALVVPGTDKTWDSRRDLPATTNRPVVLVNSSDAHAFCEWLTENGRSKGELNSAQHYRLPTDTEWSLAVGLDGEIGASPAERDRNSEPTYPWGTAFPPFEKVGNFRDHSAPARQYAVQTTPKNSLLGYDDGFPMLAPVGSFPANRLGIFDLAGNVAEMCEDDSAGENRVLVRGSSWSDNNEALLRSGHRHFVDRSSRSDEIGFRVVLDGSGGKAK